MKHALTGLCLSLLLAAGSCREDGDAKRYEALTEGLGIGIRMGMSPAEARSALGSPTVTTERGSYVQEHWLPAMPDNNVPTMPDPDVPQLTLGFEDGRLVRVFNRYKPEELGAVQPKWILEPVPGVKLGNKRSTFDEALGPPNAGEVGDAWAATDSETGAVVTLLPKFTEVESLGEALCSYLVITWEPEGTAGSGRGEFYEKQQKKKDAIHELK